MTRLLSLLFAAAPFAIAFLRAGRSHDIRLLWMAIAAIAATAVAIGVTKSRTAATSATFVLATVAAAVVGAVLGGTAVPGLVAVSSAFGVSLAVAAALHVGSR